MEPVKSISVEIDYGRCRGHQMCVIGVPDFFAVGDEDEGFAVVAVDEIPESCLPQLELAVRSCPEGAISINIR